MVLQTTSTRWRPSGDFRSTREDHYRLLKTSVGVVAISSTRRSNLPFELEYLAHCECGHHPSRNMAVRRRGYEPPLIYTPEQLMEDSADA